MGRLAFHPIWRLGAMKVKSVFMVLVVALMGAMTSGCASMISGRLPPFEYSESAAKEHVHEYKINPSMCYNLGVRKFETAEEFFDRIAGTRPELRNEGVLYQSISKDGRVRECVAPITNGKSTYCECWGTPGDLPR